MFPRLQQAVIAQHILILCTGTDASIAASQHLSLRYYITGNDFTALNEQEVTISFWAKTAANNSGDTYCGYFVNSANNRSYVWEFTPTSTWTQFTKTLTLDTSGTWLFTEADIGMTFGITLVSGSTFHGTADTWEGAQDFATSSISNFLASTSNEFYHSQVQLTLGSTAPTFTSPPIATVRKQVEYYVETLATGTDAPNMRIGLAQNIGSNINLMPWMFRTIKRSDPTMSYSGTLSHIQQMDSTGAGVTATAVSFSHDEQHGALMSVTGGGTAGDASVVYFNNGSAYVLADSRH